MRFPVYQKPGKPKLINFCAFDCETADLGGDILCWSYSLPNGESGVLYDNEDITASLFSIMLNYAAARVEGEKIKREKIPFVWYAHNADYDMRYLLEWYLRNGRGKVESLNQTKSRFCMHRLITNENIIIEIRDSYALFPRSLKEFTGQFSPNLPKLKAPAIRRFNPYIKSHRDYAERDSVALRLALENYQDKIIEDYGVGLGVTASGTALKAWEATLEKEQKYYLSVKNESFINEGRYGGLVFLTTTELVENAETYDINSSYPSVMRSEGVPVGKASYSLDWKDDRPGFFRVVVDCPLDLQIPILPTRDARGNACYRSGTFETVVTNAELKFAVRHGYKIIEVKDGIIFEGAESVHEKFVNKAEKIRIDNRKTPRESVAKLMQNGVYGKHATNPVRDSMRLFWESGLAIDCDRVDMGDELMRRPEWSAWITAQARLKLLDAAYRVGVSNVIYGDTDSLTVRSGSWCYPTHEYQYGYFKLEKTWFQFRALAPKVYAGIREIKGQLKYSGACKGIPKPRRRHWVELLAGKGVRRWYRSLDSLPAVFKRGTIAKAQLVSRFSSRLEYSGNYYAVGTAVYVKPAYSVEHGVVVNE